MMNAELKNASGIVYHLQFFALPTAVSGVALVAKMEAGLIYKELGAGYLSRCRHCEGGSLQTFDSNLLTVKDNNDRSNKNI